ncbi:MAG: hypothetical protein IJT34_07630 [Butyrivibrio sp.]|nr:hypothetical protein [Butyrivibrio sp.]
MKTGISDYENRILDILYADDITGYLNEMLAIGAELGRATLSEAECLDLAARIDRGIWFYGAEDLNASLRHVAYLHLLTKLTRSPVRYAELVRYIGRMQMEPRYLFFLLTQAGHLADVWPGLGSGMAHRDYYATYRRIVEAFGTRCGADLTRLGRKERLPHQAVILTRQYLNHTHRPTQICEDIARCMLNDLQQDVMIINTNDLLPVGHVVPLFGIEGHNSMEYLQEMNYTFIDGVSVPYFQCENNMPDVNAMKVILETIRELRPQYVVSIGHYSPVASLAARLLPVIPADDLMPEMGPVGIRANLLRHRGMISDGRYRKVVVRCI